MAGALAYLHDRGVMHRDIKPQNILLSEFGEPALSDFGVSAIVQGGSVTTATASLTPLHAPPESFDGAAPTTAADIYSLGSTLYTLLAGRAAFQGGENEAVLGFLRRLLDQPPPPIGRADVPQSLEAVLVRTLAKDPAERHGSGLELAEALRAEQAKNSWPVTPLPLQRVAIESAAGTGFDGLDGLETTGPPGVRPVPAGGDADAHTSARVGRPLLMPALGEPAASATPGRASPAGPPIDGDGDLSVTGRGGIDTTEPERERRTRLAVAAAVLAFTLLATAGFALFVRGGTVVTAADADSANTVPAAPGTTPAASSTLSTTGGSSPGSTAPGDVTAVEPAGGQSNTATPGGASPTVPPLATGSGSGSGSGSGPSGPGPGVAPPSSTFPGPTPPTTTIVTSPSPAPTTGVPAPSSSVVPATRFSDVPASSPFYADVEWLAASGVGTGFPDGTFRPAEVAERQAMAAFLYRLKGRPLGDHPTCSSAPFTDVGPTHPLCGEIKWMTDLGITSGYPDGSFKSQGPVSNEAMAAFLYRFRGSPNGPSPTCSSAPYADVPVGAPFCGEIVWMKANGLSRGFIDGTFHHSEAVLRQDAAAVLHRLSSLR